MPEPASHLEICVLLVSFPQQPAGPFCQEIATSAWLAAGPTVSACLSDDDQYRSPLPVPGPSGDAATVRSQRTGAKSMAGPGGKSVAGTIPGAKSRQGASQHAGRVMQEGDEPMDLLDSGLARK